jgi:iron complex transport system substrate-binding protein
MMKYFLLLLLLSATAASAITVEDFIGRTVTLTTPANRIVALAPHIVENLYSAGAGDKIVGVVSYSNYPLEATQVQQVGSYNAFSLETIASVKPDLIVMWGSGNGMQALQKLEALGIPVFVSEPRQLSDIPRDIRLLGKLAGTQKTAEAEAIRIEQAFASLAARFASQEELSVFYQIWNNPLQTLNGDHLISQLIELCGGKNIFWDTKNLAPKISIESVLLRNPDTIIASGMNDARPQWLGEWQAYPSLQAVKNNAIFSVDPDHIQRPTARVIMGAESLCNKLDSVRQSSP